MQVLQVNTGSAAWMKMSVQSCHQISMRGLNVTMKPNFHQVNVNVLYHARLKNIHFIQALCMRYYNHSVQTEDIH